MPGTLKIKFTARELSQMLLALCAFSIPIGSGINLITGLPLSKLFLVSVLLLIIYALLFMKFRRYMNPLFIQVYIFFMIVHTIVCFMILKPDYLNTQYYDEIFYFSLIRFLIYLLFFLFILQFLSDAKLLRVFTFFYSLGYAFTFILGLFVPESELDLGRLNGGFENPNSFGAASLMLVFLNIYQWLQAGIKGGNGIRKSGYLLFVLLGLAGLGLSQSRGALAGLLAGALYFVLWMPGLLRKIKIISGIILTLGIIVLFLPSDVVNHFLTRINIAERIGTHTESRLVIWTSYFKEIHRYWLFGNGRNLSHEIIAAYNLPEKWQAPHCRYLFILVEFGILGLSFFILGLVQLFRRTYRKELNVTSGRMLRAFCIAWFVLMLFGDYKNSRDFWLFLAIITSLTFFPELQKPYPADLKTES